MKRTLLTITSVAMSFGLFAQCWQQGLDNLTGGSSQHTSTITSTWSKHEFDITFPTQFWGKTIDDPILWYRLDAGYGSGVNVTSGGFTDGDDGSPLVTFVTSSSQNGTPPNTNQTDLYHVWDFTGQSLAIPGNGVVWFRFTYSSGGDRRREDIGPNTYTSTYQQNDNVRNGYTSFAVYTTILGDTTSVIDVLCNGDSTGQATITGYGLFPPFTYQWDSNANNQTDSTATGLAAGSYLVSVTDSLGCTRLDTVVVNEPPAISTTAVGSDMLCNSDTTGSASVAASGGTPGYTYLWSNSQTDTLITGILGGTYYVTVTDSNNCTHVDSAIVNEPDPITINFNTTNQQTSNCDGDATANPSGGTPGYSYQWDSNAGNQTTATATGLCGGTFYYVTVTDTNNCTTIDSVYVDYPVGITTYTINNIIGMYPNPASESVEIVLSTPKPLEVYNSLGELVLTIQENKARFHLNVKELAKGVYYIKAGSSNTEKLIVQ